MPNRKQSALNKLANAGSYSKTSAEVLDFTYYDTFSLLSTALIHRMFVTPLGQAGKTLADTNMILAGLLPQGQNLTIRRFKFFYVTDTAMATADIQTFYSMLKDVTFEFSVPGKENLGQFPLLEIIGMPTAIALTPSVAGDNIAINQPIFKGIFPLNKPIRIGATQAFEVRIQHHVAPGAALDGNRLMIGLNGKLIRMS